MNKGTPMQANVNNQQPLPLCHALAARPEHYVFAAHLADLLAGDPYGTIKPRLVGMLTAYVELDRLDCDLFRRMADELHQFEANA